MGMRNYGIYHQGAIFYLEDFDPCKVITAVCEKILNFTLPDTIKKALDSNKYDVGVAEELCEILDIDMKYGKDACDYSFISDILVADADHDEWFKSKKPLMGTQDVEVFVFTEIEGEYAYDSEDKSSESVEDCFMFSLDFPFVWRINDYISENKNCRSKGEVLRLIRKNAEILLIDDIDWENRLGSLVGSYFG